MSGGVRLGGGVGRFTFTVNYFTTISVSLYYIYHAIKADVLYLSRYQDIGIKFITLSGYRYKVYNFISKVINQRHIFDGVIFLASIF